MIKPSSAAKLLDFGARLGDSHRAQEQLDGAVALHAMLEKHGVAYLADEVGMGKTYVALGVLALYRHVNPDFRVLVIAPRANIQAKWQKELKNFVRHNVRYSDLSVCRPDGDPARRLVHCENLMQLVRETGRDPDRDFFLRMPSFSMALGSDIAQWKGIRAQLRREMPWIPKGSFDLRDKSSFKERVACAICAALPHFDLVIVDEAHNLKHGFGPQVADRNRTMGLVFGHPHPDLQGVPIEGYGSRAQRVLLLSATPIEDDYRQLYHQLDVFGRAEAFAALADPKASEETKKNLTRQFLIRRVTAMQVGGQELTKNQYRREWRRGGVALHDEPLEVGSDRERLVVALMQKKVSELLGLEKFGAQFQIGMLASFESFIETSRTVAQSQGQAIDDGEVKDAGNFDDSEQTEDAAARRGIDVDAINHIARDHRENFGAELPHPKMNALVADLKDAWRTGEKGLIFVRRVRSVIELKRRLDDEYDTWLLDHLLAELPSEVGGQLQAAFAEYRSRQIRARGKGEDHLGETHGGEGDVDTFFAYFFRGDGPDGLVSGATIQRYFVQDASVYASFFEDNHVAWLLGVRPGSVLEALASALTMDVAAVRRNIDERGQWFLSNAATVTRGHAFAAAQAAAVDLMRSHPGPLEDPARFVWHERYEPHRKSFPREATERNLARWLERPTFFTELRTRPDLREALWPGAEQTDFDHAFREQEERREFLAAAARLGHSLIDLYVLAVHELGTLEGGARRARDNDSQARDQQRIDAYLDRLEQQMLAGETRDGFTAFDELSQIAENFELLVDVNVPDIRDTGLHQLPRLLADLMRRQQPTGGASGGSMNQTLVRQFRMPGYPFVLIATDVLQEGEDLHTFCSRIYHYGISWTPSSMEQRTGRIDRVRSQTDRRLSHLGRKLVDEERLQVHFPHLGDTVESLQVRRVLRRMDRFLRLMHEGLAAEESNERSVQVGREILARVDYPEPIEGRLETAFAIPAWALAGTASILGRTESDAETARERFGALTHEGLGELSVDWEPYQRSHPLMGTARLGDRIQPFALYLGSVGEHLSIRCISPVGEVELEDDALLEVIDHAAELGAPVAAVLGRTDGTYNLTVEDDVLLGDVQHDAERIGSLVGRVVHAADDLEQEFLEPHDARLPAFRKDLARERKSDV